LRIVVIGAGIVGVTTAYELAADGHEVTVYERRAAVAAEASFANAGVVAPGYVTPWAAPGMPWKVMRHCFSRHTPVRLGWGALGQLPWLWSWWRACRPAVHVANRTAMQKLAHFSRERMQELTQTLQLGHEQAQGYVVLLRSARDLALAQRGLALLTELGVPHTLIDAAQCRQIEPGLNPDAKLHAAIHLPQDGVGNCRQFAHLLMQQARRLGADFRFDMEVTRIVPGTAPRIDVRRSIGLAGAGTTGDAGDTVIDAPDCDAVVVCAGVQAKHLLGGIGLKLPLAPVHGYSITAPLRHVDGHAPLGPRGGLMDERYKVAISRLGQRVRVAGGAELGAAPGRMNPAALATLYRVLDDWFPGAAVQPKVQHWKGARPMLPDGPPVLGASGMPGVWLNLGHGSSGWALSCGSARVLAEAVAGRAPPVDVTRLGVERVRR
jgi:D-amino-acid dehydrogenase